MSSTVLVTGCTGYIAQHIVKFALAKGYSVIGTGRSKSRLDSFASLVNSDKFSVEVVPDIAVAGAFDDLFKRHPEINFVVHAASPVVFEPKDPEKEILNPAIDGTKGVLDSIYKFGTNVEKVVITSSNAAHNAPFDHYGKKGRVVSEKDWSNITWEQAFEEPAWAYWASKKFAEQAAWKFIEDNKPKFTLTTVSPTWCYGPQAFDETVSDVLPSTSEILHAVLKLGPNDEVISSPMVAVDVRDVAEAHISALEIPEAAGQRLYLFDKKVDEQYFLNVINDKFPELRGKIPNPPQRNTDDIDCITCDCTKTLSILKTTPRPIEVSIVDAVAQILKYRASA